MLLFSRLVTMWNHVLFLFLTIFGSLANLSTALNASDTECKNIKGKLASSEVRDYITCHHEIWLRPEIDHNKTTTALHVVVTPYTANFDEDSSLLSIQSWMVIAWDDERLAWDPKKFSNVTDIMIPKPDIAVLSAESDDVYRNRPNHTTCEVFYFGNVACLEPIHHTIRCQTDFTFWPYDRQNCTLVITSWSHTTEKLIFANANHSSRIDLHDLRSNQEWNISVSRVSFDLRPTHYYYANIYHPQMTIDFVVDRVHSHEKGRFVASAIIMMSMTLTTLWLDPKSIERLAISSLNIIIHMMCVRDLHRVLPQNGTTVPNILIFYVNSFVFAILAIFLTYVLGKIEESKVWAPKWIISGTDSILKSKTGKMLLVCMLDSKVTAGIETGSDGNRDFSRTESDNSNWKYVAIFLGWIAFFSFFFAYIFMYAILIPNSSSRPPANLLI